MAKKDPMLQRQQLPNASAQIEVQLAAAGFKIVDKMEGASVAFVFFPDGSLNMAGADQGLSQASINTDKVSGSIGAAAGFVSTVGVGGAGIGLLVGALIPQDEVLYLNGLIFKKPSTRKSWFGEAVITTEKKGTTVNTVVVDYTFADDKTKQPTQDTVLKMAINEWITRYVNIPTSAAQAVTPEVPHTSPTAMLAYSFESCLSSSEPKSQTPSEPANPFLAQWLASLANVLVSAMPTHTGMPVLCLTVLRIFWP